MEEKFSFFIALCPYDELKNCFDLLPNTCRMYVKCEMEQAGVRKVAIVWHNKVTVNHVIKRIPFFDQICGSKCTKEGRHLLKTKYIRWRSWMNEYQYEKLSQSLRKRSKFLNRPWLPDPKNPYKVRNFFEERLGLKKF